MLLKRAIDLVLSAAVLVLMSPVMAIAALALFVDCGRPIIFSQLRVGRNFRTFRILKFRTMVVQDQGPTVTVAGDPRVTRVGAILRRTKLDELPQFWNVIRGEMSIVGPRPEIPYYVDLFRNRYQRILLVRPGITDDASIHYRDEEQLLSASNDPFAEYRDRILPIKLDLADRYIRDRSTRGDLRIILQTALATFRPLPAESEILQVSDPAPLAGDASSQPLQR